MSTAAQFGRFVLTGGGATAIHYAIFWAVLRAEWANPVVASSVGFAVSALANYAANARFTFRSTRPHAEALPRFCLVALAGLFWNAVLIWLMHSVLGVNLLLAQLVATVCVLGWNFALNRIWTFSGQVTTKRA